MPVVDFYRRCFRDLSWFFVSGMFLGFVLVTFFWERDEGKGICFGFVCLFVSSSILFFRVFRREGEEGGEGGRGRDVCF